MMMARPKWRAVSGKTASSIAPSRRCRCQSSGRRSVRRVVMTLALHVWAAADKMAGGEPARSDGHGAPFAGRGGASSRTWPRGGARTRITGLPDSWAGGRTKPWTRPGLSCVRGARAPTLGRMLDTMASSAQMQRVKGRAGARIGASGRLKDLYQQGSAKVLLPKMHGRAPEVVFLNTAGGVTGGDRLSYSLDVEDGAAAVGTTQTAERGYLSARGRGRIEARLTVGAGGRLHWLPQEMILFDGAALDRQVTVEMAGDAECLMLETLVLGRAAMGERLSRLTLRDRREVIRDGVPAMVEAISLDDADLSRSGPAGLNGAVALSTLVL